jgi:23S rRNA pseudouridine1911/1915/1917 synthase
MAHLHTTPPAEPDDDEDLALEPSSAALQTFTVGAAEGGTRIDKLLAQWLQDVSRSRIKQWITAGAVRVNGRPPAPDDAAIVGDRVEVAPLPLPEEQAFQPESMPLDIVHADESIIVLDKPPGIVVHPGAGNWSGTLLNGLLAYDTTLAQLPRAGIVHRLDADTSGLMVIARTVAAQLDLVRQLQARSVTREYWALALGQAPAAVTIDAALERDPRNPLRFRTSTAVRAKAARTHVRRVAVHAGPPAVSWIACRLETGRTHQIRVHLESIGHPLLGDPVYRRGRAATPLDAQLSRQALHACRLALTHPRTGARLTWFRAPPADMRTLMLTWGWDSAVDRRTFE